MRVQIALEPGDISPRADLVVDPTKKACSQLVGCRIALGRRHAARLGPPWPDQAQGHWVISPWVEATRDSVGL